MILKTISLLSQRTVLNIIIYLTLAIKTDGNRRQMPTDFFNCIIKKIG